MTNVQETFPAQFERALLKRGGSAEYARKMRRVAARYMINPQEALQGRAPKVTQATINDLVTRLRIFGNWMERAHPARPNPWLALTRLEAGRQARDRASFNSGDVRALLSCSRIPKHRRAFYRAQATLGLRPVEAGRLKREHFIKTGNDFAIHLPASCQKSGRADRLTVTAKESRELQKHLPLLRKPLNHYERTFTLDIQYAGIAPTVNGAVRQMYDLRSFYADTLFDSKELSLKDIQGLMRHADPETTLRHYARFNSRKAGRTRAGIFQPLN